MQIKLPRPFGRYMLVRRLAVGGMGQVFLALATTTGGGFRKLVALKILPPTLATDTALVEMFFDEARLAALLSHGNIVSAFDFGDVDGLHYLALEYVHGTTLQLALQAGQPPLQTAVTIALGAVNGLAFAHQAADEHGNPLGIIHRDIAPKNILLSYSGDVRLTDFGIAKADSNVHMTAVGIVKGSVDYMPMEQFKEQGIDARSDVYAMGVTLYELFTRRRLFRFSKSKVRRDAIDETKRHVPPLRDINPDLPQLIDAVVHRALAPRPEDRYANGRLLLEALRAVAEEEGIHPRPELISRWLADCMPEDSQKPPLTKAELQRVELAAAATGSPLSNLSSETHRMLSGAKERSDRKPAQKTTALPRQHRPANAERDKPQKSSMAKSLRVVLIALGGLVLLSAVALAAYYLGRVSR